MATNTDLLHDLHLTQVDEEQAAISRMYDSVCIAEKSDGFSGWVVLERPRHSAKLRSIGILVKPHAATGDRKKPLSRMIETWRCRVHEIPDTTNMTADL